MPNRTAKFTTAILAGLLAGASLVTLSPPAAGATADCLSAPRDQTPDGSHWYYRIDHPRKRQCWYLRQEGEKASQSAAPSAASPAGPIAPAAETAASRTLADARAELPPQTRGDAWKSDEPPNSAPPSNVANVPRAANPKDANAPSSVVASRWPETLAMASAAPAPVAADPVTRESPPPTTQPLPPLAAGELAAADTSSQPSSHSLRMLLVALIGVLALLGVIARATFRSRRARQRERRQYTIRARRDALWKRTDDNRTAWPARRDADVLPRRPAIPRDLDRADNPVEQIEEFLLQRSRRASN